MGTRFAEHLDRKAEQIISELQDQPEIQVTVMESVASALTRLREEELAVPWLKGTVEIHRDVLESDGRTVALNLRRLADALDETGNADEAEKHYGEALEMLRRLTDRPDPDLADHLMEYGVRFNLSNQNSS